MSDAAKRAMGKRPRSEFHLVADHGGHKLQFEFVPRAKNAKELYAVFDGRRIACRANETWVSIVTGYEVIDEDYPDKVVVYFDGRVVQ